MIALGLKLLSFGKANWKLLGALFLLLSALAYERHQGAESIRKADRKAEARAVAKAAPVTAALAQSAVKAGAESDAGRERIIYRTRTIIQRIPNEIPRSSDVRLSGGFVRLYNASLGLPEGPGSAAQPADGSGGLYSADALVQAIVPNNSACAWYSENYPRLLRLYDEAHDKVNGFRP